MEGAAGGSVWLEQGKAEGGVGQPGSARASHGQPGCKDKDQAATLHFILSVMESYWGLGALTGSFFACTFKGYKCSFVT